MKAGEALDEIKERASLKSPHLIYCTNLRKHCATIAQVKMNHNLKNTGKYNGRGLKLTFVCIFLCQ